MTEIRQALPADLPRLLDLQTHVLAQLPASQRYYIVPKSEAQFRQYLDSPTEARIYYLEKDGQLAAQFIFRQTVRGAEEARHAEALTHLKLGSALPPYGLLQGALVDPAFRGQHLLRHMLEYAVRIADKSLAFLLARVVPGNIASWVSFLQAGFHITAAAYDPDDERQVFYLYRSFMPTSYNNERQGLPWDDFEAIRRLTLKGWRGCDADRAEGKIIFAKLAG